MALSLSLVILVMVFEQMAAADQQRTGFSLRNEKTSLIFRMNCVVEQF